MKDPNLATVIAALAVAVSLGLARDLTHNEGSASFAESNQPKFIAASTSQYRTGSQHQSGTGWSVKDSQGGVLPPSKDANPEQ
jgi:hypothetical protein